MLEVIKESQENREIVKRHKSQGRFGLLRNGNTNETQKRITVTTAAGYCDTGALNSEGKMKISEMHPKFEVIRSKN